MPVPQIPEEPNGNAELLSSTLLRALLAKLQANPHPDRRIQARAVCAIRAQLRRAERHEARQQAATLR
jgi:hypothetical protein